MKNITQYILEARSNKYPKAVLAAIRKNICGGTVEFDIKGWDFTDTEIFKDGKYAHFKYTAKNGKDVVKKNDLIMMWDDKISLADIDLDNDKYESKLVSTEYNEKENLTYLKYKVQSLRFNHGFAYLTGTITIKVPSDVINAKEDYSNFDCKKYDQFMEKFLSQKEEYLSQFKVGRDVESWSSMVSDNVLKITVILPTGKGYGDNHMHTKTYKFTWKSHSYDCTTSKLYDRDEEAQIVRKFISGISKCVGGKDLPEKVDVFVQQELD